TNRSEKAPLTSPPPLQASRLPSPPSAISTPPSCSLLDGKAFGSWISCFAPRRSRHSARESCCPAPLPRSHAVSFAAFWRRKPRPASSPARRARLSLEALQDRAVPAILTVTSVDDSTLLDGFVTLREALTAASTNAASGDAPAGDAGLDTIKFNIAGAPGTVHTIKLMSALPFITDPVFIDGYSQLGATPNTLADGDNAFLAIELDGLNTVFQAGLTIVAGNSTVQGLVINRFGNEGILLITNGGNVVRGNFIGTDQTGQLDRGNGVAGVTVLSSNNTIGGTAP